MQCSWQWSRYFYPRPPRGGRREAPENERSKYLISIHALREEGDFCTMIRGTFRQYFYPRPPRGGRPVFPVRRDADRDDFYPRPPRGGRHDLYAPFGPGEVFLSTPSARRATWHGGSYWFWPGAISIHALREEGDTTFTPRLAPERYFYPRPPRGGRPTGASANNAYELFLSTPSARRATIAFSIGATFS